ncbi:WD domain, G-beta repeat protein [Geosmithia morbida]|uniref:WD domain, G-beta repeat protein n=1 Tax=Geosmithia morbida TaxID=1094350 RepID=A0A9P4Z0E0_9HYPO|nr:WD domain, G-beta repeat protein [Geosmithia morbida]KAF4125847.1 WD domain, G-beta repeat protein [Geosmithia morbida]
MSTGKSSAVRRAAASDFSTMPPTQDLRHFDPCAATGSMFLYAQGTSIVCCHHDTLTIERRFSNHSEEVQLLAVDNQSETGSGRFVVSYDAGQTAIVWDLMTGDEITRFASYSHLTAAAFMPNGSVAFGNSQGSVVLFEPQTSEHVSSRTLDQIAITSIAPSSDCRTFALGYQNGSLLIATLQPRFSILHNLATSRTPSPIVTLAWHASSSRQKSDMLATQTYSGDLRVWSVSKPYSADEPAKVVRILKRSDSISDGPNWMGWSKNGRIIQFSDGQTLSWDVRTKHITSDNIPTLDKVKGLALWGPGASLFTLGMNNTLQQFDLNSPSIMVANVQHPANLLPPSPPNSIEEVGMKSAHSTTTTIQTTSESESSAPNISESDEDHMPAIARFNRRPGPDSGTESYESYSPGSSRSGLSSRSRSSAASRTPGRSLASGPKSDYTYISAGTPISQSTIGQRREADNYSMGYSIGSSSVTSASSVSHSGRRPSRLRHEVPRSPDDNRVHDLFKFTRTRLSDVPYKAPSKPDNVRLTNDDLRRQMLSTIFGWDSDIKELIVDEMNRHPTGSSSRILLAKWLGNMEIDIMSASTENMTSSDWMLLALSGIGGHASQHKLGRTYVQRLLETGDVHVAVTIMLGMGDHNDAIEVYISHKRYMEALILACLCLPGVWERQAAILRKWGEWAVQHHQQQLAIRCFACTDQEPTEMWTSPSAQQLNFTNITPSIPEVLSPPLSPPGVQRGPQRSVGKNSALKLITSFGDHSQKAKFYSQSDDMQTPIAAGVTPIAESAVSPGGSYDAATAFLRPSNNSRFNTPVSARGRARLPSIGEIPQDLNRETLRGKAGHSRAASGSHSNLSIGQSLQRAATASPMMMTSDPPPPPGSAFLNRMEEFRTKSRNGSRDRIPLGVNLELHTEHGTPADVTSPDQSVASSTRYHWPTRRRGAGSIAGSLTSASSAGRSMRSNVRSKEDYIHSLDTAQRYSKKKNSSRHRSRSRNGSRSRERRPGSRERSEDRGRSTNWQSSAKRSPTSPVPMSPEDLANLSTPRFSEVGTEPSTVRKARSKQKSRNSSRGSRNRHNSPDSAKPRPLALDTTRGRGSAQESSFQRSPSSPLPRSASAAHYQGSEDEEDYQRAIQAQEMFRARHQSSRGVTSPIVGNDEPSSGSRLRAASESKELHALTVASLATHSRATSTEHAGDLRRMKDERQLKKEQAARELEERRKSLAQRSRAPAIPNPSDQLHVLPLRIGVEMAEPAWNEDLPPRSATEPPPQGMYARGGPNVGLPATPKAMRLIIGSDDDALNMAQEQNANLPGVPPIPATFAQRHSPKVSPNASEEEREKKDEPAPLTLLPSTVYQPPPRLGIPRSMSAPIPQDGQDPRHARRHGSGHSRNAPGRRPSQGEQGIPPPPPPPPAPPMLKELQHLATPPPPPPAPLPPHFRRGNSQPSGLSAGTIEIVMDDDDSAPVAVPSDGTVPVIAPPAPPASRGHSRGRSNGGDSNAKFSDRISKATERLRSASRGRREAQRVTKVDAAPYESVPMPPQPPKTAPPIHYDPDVVRSPVEGHGLSHRSTGLSLDERF